VRETRFIEGPRGGFYRGRGGGEWPGEAEKRLAMVGSFNGFFHFGIEGGVERMGRRRTRLGFLGRGGIKAVAAARGGVWRGLEEEEAWVAGWAGPRWLGILGRIGE
jgi:hypothetical protein